MKTTDVEALHLRVPHVREIADGTQDVLSMRVRADNGLDWDQRVSLAPGSRTGK